MTSSKSSNIHTKLLVLFSLSLSRPLSISFHFHLVCMHYKIYKAVFVYFRTFICVWRGVFIYGKFLDSHVVIWMLQFTDIVSSDVAIVGSIERCKSSMNGRKRKGMEDVERKKRQRHKSSS